MNEAIKEADRCPHFSDSRTPRLAAILVKNGREIARVHRGELDPHEHAEYMLLKKKLLNPTDAVGATLYVTLEPCTLRRHDKKTCMQHIINSGISKVFIGTLDPNPDILKVYRLNNVFKQQVSIF